MDVSEASCCTVHIANAFSFHSIQQDLRRVLICTEEKKQPKPLNLCHTVQTSYLIIYNSRQQETDEISFTTVSALE